MLPPPRAVETLVDLLDTIFDVLTDCVAEAIIGGLDDAVDDHAAMRTKGAELRASAAMLALLGPTLLTLARAVRDEAVRKSVPRFQAYYEHPRYSADPPINELDDAQTTLNAAILAASGATPPTAAQAFKIALAAARVRAITMTVGLACIAEPAKSDRSKKAPDLRRRKIGADDVPAEVASVLVEMVQGEREWAAGIVGLGALETTRANEVGIVSNLLALAGQPDGRAHLNTIVMRLERARFNKLRDDGSPIALSDEAARVATGIQHASTAKDAKTAAVSTSKPAAPVAEPNEVPEATPRMAASAGPSSAGVTGRDRFNAIAKRFQTTGSSRADAERFLAERHRKPDR